jgi:hypothetical protein
MPKSIALFALCLTFVCACGGTASQTTTTPAPLAVAAPSFVPANATLILRFDSRTTRQTAISADIARMIAVSGTWSRLSAGSGADPIADVDIMLCAARAEISSQGFWAPDWYFVLRAPEGAPDLEQRISRMAEANGEPASWQSRDGFRFVSLPVDPGAFSPHFAMQTARGEVVVAPLSALDRVLDVARQQAQVRRGDEAVDPWLVTERDEIVFLRLDAREQSFPAIASLPPFRSFELRAQRRDAQVVLDLRAAFDTESEATIAFEQVDLLRRQASDNPLARLFGLTHALETATVSPDGSSIHAEAQLDAYAARGLARVLTQAQQ